MRGKAQPRIKGIKRDAIGSMLHPLIRECVEEIAHRERKSISYVIAELLGGIGGIDAATGEKTHKQRRKRVRR